jgi:hypothetical protein
MSLKISFYTSEENKGLIPEPVPAYKEIPKWFSDLPMPSAKKCPFRFLSEDKKEIGKEINNTKTCPGIFDFLSSGYIIKSWSTFLFREESEGQIYINWVDSVVKNELTHHSSSLVGEYFNEDDPYKFFLKLKSPWYMKTDPGVSTLILHPLWNNENRFSTAAGIYHTDISPLEINWMFKWNKKINTGMELDGMSEDQIVEINTPLMCLVPFYRKKFESEINYIENWKIDRLQKSMWFTNHSASRIRKSFYRMITQKFGLNHT